MIRKLFGQKSENNLCSLCDIFLASFAFQGFLSTQRTPVFSQSDAKIDSLNGLPSRRRRTQIRLTDAALHAAFRVECAAARAAYVHRSREPVGDERAGDEDDEEYRHAQERVFQLLYLSCKLL